ncbi:pseudouridine synthase [Marinicellulosiphila megalodicopiae]|uniref:pseudouridine synthase n=1 Tax=Marinicellulosiphila megalodicopiae TaxID=2724896 RepID=UPI003BAEDAA4
MSNQEDPILEICYIDENYVVINKPRGMLVHPVDTPHPKNEIAMKVIRDQLGKQVYTVHRLDRPTSGLLLFALNVPAVQIMQKMFEQQQVQKKYIAVVHGKTQHQWQNNDELEKPENKEMKSASTSFRQLQFRKKGSFAEDENLEVSILEAQPHSGRYHQIRRHLANANLPIVGDYLYGDIDHNIQVAEHTQIPRMMLMAHELSFTHPFTQQPITINAPLCEDFKYYYNKI